MKEDHMEGFHQRWHLKATTAPRSVDVERNSRARSGVAIDAPRWEEPWSIPMSLPLKEPCCSLPRRLVEGHSSSLSGASQVASSVWNHLEVFRYISLTVSLSKSISTGFHFQGCMTGAALGVGCVQVAPLLVLLPNAAWRIDQLQVAFSTD